VYLVVILAATASCFIAEVHSQITEAGLQSVSLFQRNRYYYFLPSSIAIISEANAAQDADDTPEIHFYDEKFSNSSQYIIDLRAEIIHLVTRGDDSIDDAGKQAKILLGRALGTLQDFYASTTWINIGNTEPFYNLTSTALDDPFGDQPCPDSQNVFDTDDLTSGYFTEICSPPPNGKCAHGDRRVGTGLAGTTPCGPGINKDSPGKRGFQTAYDQALNHTIYFLEALLIDIVDHTDDESSALRVFMEDQEQPDPNYGRRRCLPYCAVFTVVPGLILITALLVFLVGKNVVSSPFSSMSQQPREIQQSQPV